MPFLFSGFESPAVATLPNSVLDELVVHVHSMAEIKVVLFAIRHTYGVGQSLDVIADSRFVNGLRGAGIAGHEAVLNRGAGLCEAEIHDGLERAVADGFLERCCVCPECGREIPSGAFNAKTRAENNDGHADRKPAVGRMPVCCATCKASLVGRDVTGYCLCQRGSAERPTEMPEPQPGVVSGRSVRGAPKGTGDLVGALYLLFLVAQVLIMARATYGASPMLHMLFIPPTILAVVLTIGLVVFTVLAWKDRYWNVWGRLHYTLITLAAFVFIPFLYY